jgi:hypothetical protein
MLVAYLFSTPKFLYLALRKIKLDEVFSTKILWQRFGRESIPVEISKLIGKIFKARVRKVHSVFFDLEVRGIIEYEKFKTVHPCKGISFQAHFP